MKNIPSLKSLSLKKKFELIVLFCLCLITTVSFLCFHFLSKAYEKSLYYSVSNTLSYSADNIILKTNNIEALSELILGDSNVQSSLSTLRAKNPPSRQEQKALFETLYRSLSNCLFGYNGNSNITSITIQITDRLCVNTSTKSYSLLPDDVIAGLSEKAEASDGASVWVTDYADSYGVFLVKELKKTYALSLEPIGILIMQINMEDLTEQNSPYLNSDDSSYVLTDGSHILYQNGSFSEKISEALNQLSGGYQIVTIDRKKVFAVKQEIYGVGWNCYSLVPYNSIFQTSQFAKYICIIVFLICLTITFLLGSRLMSTQIYYIEMLVQKMKFFGRGKYHPSDFPQFASKRADELGLLHRSFDSMVDKINKLVFDNYTNEILKRDAQIKAMENQINPHFLYNTLDTINWRARAIGADDIMKISQSLGNLLRITLKDPNTAEPYTVATELDVLNCYITIQKQRYGKRLDFEIHISEIYLSYEIPKLLLQPLLENAIYYGLEENPDICHISVTAVQNEEYLVFRVQNTGSSFEEDLLNKLADNIILPHGNGIGLLNIDRRVKLTYGNSYGLKLYNRQDFETNEEYAIAELYLPLN